MSLASNGYELLPYQTKQIRKILTHIKGRKNLHIYGAEGTGKTALLDYVYDNWKKMTHLSSRFIAEPAGR